MKLGHRCYHPETGEPAEVVGSRNGKAVARTTSGKVFTPKGIGGQKSGAGRKPSMSQRYANGDLKLCNCAGCHMVMLSSAHVNEVESARRHGEDVGWLPPFVGVRVKGRPYCSVDCAKDKGEM